MRAAVRAPGLAGPVVAAVLTGGYLLGGIWMAVAAAGVGVVVAGELFSRARRAGLRPLAPLGLATIAALAAVGHIKADRVSRALVGVMGALVIAAFGEMLVRTDRRRLIETVLSSLVPVTFIALPVAYLAAMRQLPEGERLAGTLLLVVVGAEMVARALARITGAGIGGAAAGPSRSSLVRLIGAGIGAAAAAAVASGAFDPAVDVETVAAIATVGGVAVGVSQPIATLLETVAAPGEISPTSSVTRVTTGLFLAAPFAFYIFLLLAR